ncbi:MAG: hypothetical protein DHS20C14_05800 [Phycisphaeraceae bacterium]|nr:MAG: hypothetical protein DHS20C14_05800 [Phycisphaeraceae bacterium]
MTLAPAFVVLAVAARIAPAQVVGRPAAEVAGEAERLMGAYTQGWNFHGVVLIADGDTILYEGAYGYANAEYDEPQTTETVFRIASLSKQFTAGALLPLRDEGRVDFDAPLSTYLVRLKPEIANHVTLASAFGHTAGLARAPRSMARDRRKQDHFELRELIDLIN